MLVSGSVKKFQESQMVYLVASMMCIAAIQGLSSQLTVGTPWGNPAVGLVDMGTGTVSGGKVGGKSRFGVN